MKKIVATILALALAVSLIILAIALALSVILAFNARSEKKSAEEKTISAESYYPHLARVIELDYDKDIVTVEDGNGFCWQFSNCSDWTLGELCNLLMFDNDTSDRISDDIIVRTFYSNLPKEVVK